MATSEDMAAPVGRLDNGRANGTGKVCSGDRGPRDDGPTSSSGAGLVSAPGSVVGMAVAPGSVRYEAEPWDRSASIAQRLIAAQRDAATLTLDAEIKGTTKSGGTYTYRGITSAQIVTRAKEVLTRNGVLYWPDLAKDAVTVNGNQTAVFLTGHFINADNASEVLSFSAWGSDTDNSGKGYMKALTNANKQVLSKALMLSTVEDEASEDVEHDAQPRSRQVREAEALTDAAIKTWADAYKSALDGCRTLADLKRVRGENAHMMSHAGVPAVTKEYFIDKITALESALE